MIKIDPELRDLIPPLREEELAELEKSIAAEGVRDPLVIWKGKGVILDGHNRFEIATRIGMPFDIVHKKFSTVEEAKLWMIGNQLGRRNLNPDQFRVMLGRLYNQTKKAVGENQHTVERVGKSYPASRTSQKIASTYNVSEKSVRNYAKAVEEIEEAASKPDAPQAIKELPKKITTGETTVAKARREVREAKEITDKIPTPRARRAKGVVRVVKTPEGFAQAIKKHFDRQQIGLIKSLLP